MMDRAFLGIKQLYGNAGFERIQSAHFLVVGIGGVGSWICESLVRSGALKLSLVDLDDICVSNINRQIHSLSTNVGQSKIDEMKKRLLTINPEVQIECIHDFFSESTKDEILKRDYTYIFDGIDSLKSKCILLAECKAKGLPVICSGGAGGKVDPTQIEITDLNRTINDQLLFRVRKNLKRNFGFPRYENKKFKIPAVYSKELPSKDTGPSGKLDCGSFGSVSFVTASFAFAAVSHVLKEITHE